jgi:hypothetical protein
MVFVNYQLKSNIYIYIFFFPPVSSSKPDVIALAAGGISSSAVVCGFLVFAISKDTSYKANTFSLSQPVTIFVCQCFLVVSFENNWQVS